jgi:hypothetical protein
MAPADAEDGRAVYYVYTDGSGDLRCVDEPPDRPGILPMSEFFHPHVLVHHSV